MLPRRAPLTADPAGCARCVLPGWLACVFLSLTGAALGAQPDNPSVALKKADAAKTSASVKAPETKKPVQAVLPLEETPVVKREGFRWDESKGIE